MHPPSAFGTFRVLHQIGSGVLGPVFRAYDSQRDRLAVVKLFKLDLVPEQASAFADRLRDLVARPVDDNGVVRGVDAGLSGGLPYLALELIGDDSLDAILRENRPGSIDDVVAFCRSMASAIDAAWEIGIGHGALHPRDVFVHENGSVAVTGFGIAQALQSVGQKPPVRRPYSAPERIEAGAWDRRADVYSLGAIAQELLARVGAPSPEMGAVLEQALAERPEDRFATAAAFVEALSAAVAATPRTMVSAAAVTTNAHRVVEIDAPEGVADPVASAPLRDAALEDTTLSTYPSTRVPEYPSTRRPPFPWPALAAVALAGLSVGALGGFEFGYSRGRDTAIDRAMAEPALTQAAQPPALAETPRKDVSEPPPVRLAPEPVAPAQPRRERVAAPATGSIDFDSRPRRARVLVNGRLVGHTPYTAAGLSPGDHRVLIELAGHRRVSTLVKVVAGENKPVRVSLEQLVGGR